MPGSYYHGALAVVGIYDVSDETSLTALKKWFDDAVRYAGSDVTRVLVGEYHTFFMIYLSALLTLVRKQIRRRQSGYFRSRKGIGQELRS